MNIQDCKPNLSHSQTQENIDLFPKTAASLAKGRACRNEGGLQSKVPLWEKPPRSVLFEREVNSSHP